MKKLIILDRDGVINYDSADYIKSPAEWIPIPGSLQAIAKLNKQGFNVAIATNQSGLGRGLFSLETLEAIHDKLHEYVALYGGEIKKIVYCRHHPDDNCDCRKPKPGLLQQLADEFQCDLTGVPMVGDSLRDLQAAQAMNCQPILVLTGKGQKTRQQLNDKDDIPIHDNLSQAVHWLLNRER